MRLDKPRRVRISECSGLESGKTGVVLRWSDARCLKLIGEYPFVGGRTPYNMRWLAVLLDDGRVTAMPHNRLRLESEQSAS